MGISGGVDSADSEKVGNQRASEYFQMQPDVDQAKLGPSIRQIPL